MSKLQNTHMVSSTGVLFAGSVSKKGQVKTIENKNSN